MVSYYMRDGRLEGTMVGKKMLYTEEQLEKADFARRKPGPKGPRKKKEEKPA